MGRRRNDPSDPVWPVWSEALSAAVDAWGGTLTALSDALAERGVSYGQGSLSYLVNGRTSTAPESLLKALSAVMLGGEGYWPWLRPLDKADEAEIVLWELVTEVHRERIVRCLEARGIHAGFFRQYIADLSGIGAASMRLLLGSAGGGVSREVHEATLRAIHEAVRDFEPEKPSPFDLNWYRAQAMRSGLGSSWADELLSAVQEDGDVLGDVQRLNAGYIGRVLVGRRLRTALEASGYSLATVAGRMQSEHGVSVAEDALAEWRDADATVVRLEHLEALEEVLGVHQGIRSVLAGSGPEGAMLADIRFAELESLLLNRDEFQPWHPKALGWIVDAAPGIRLTLGLSEEPQLSEGAKAAHRIAAIDAIAAAVKAAPPGQPFVTQEWALQRLRALYPDNADATLRGLVELPTESASAKKPAKAAKRSKAKTK